MLPLGDSITGGCCTPPGGGYRIELFRRAVTNQKHLTFVGTLTNGPTSVANQTFPRNHEGHGGYTIAGGVEGAIAGPVTANALSMFHPNIVLLLIGTNDVNEDIDVANAPTKLGQLIDQITSGEPAALVVISSIPPIREDDEDDASGRARTFNAAIPGIVAARAQTGKHVVFVDSYAAFAQDPNFAEDLLEDGLHPNAAGYVLLGQVFYGAIAGVLPATP